MSEHEFASATTHEPKRLTWQDILANVFMLTVLIFFWLILIGFVVLAFTVIGWGVIPATALFAVAVWLLMQMNEDGDRG